MLGYCSAATSLEIVSAYWWMIPIEIKRPVPEVNAPKLSAMKLSDPIIIPLRTTKVGIYLLSIRSMIFDELRNPGTCIPESIICCAISRGASPLTSTQTFPNEIQRTINIMRYITARNGSSINACIPCGGERI